MSRRASLLTVLAVVLVALNLRGAIAAVPPVLDRVSADVGLTRADAALLTSLPVLLFALAAPLAAWLDRRLGAGYAVLLGLVVLLLGTVGRVLGGPVALLLGTAVLGLGATVANVLVPVVIKRDLPGHASRVTGFYTASLAIGAGLTSALTVPLAAWAGWRTALALWALLVPVAAVGWWWHVARPARAPSRPQPGVGPRPQPQVGPRPLPARPRDSFVWRLPMAWALALALGSQSALYYSLTTWMPVMLVDLAGLSEQAAGGAMSLYQVTAIPMALTIAAFAALRPSQGWIGVVIAVGWAVAVLGLVLAPAAWAVWSVVGGLAQGAGFTYALTLVVLRGADEHVVRALGAMGQLVGYSIGAAGPLAVGWLAQTSGGWLLPAALLVALAVLLGASSLVAGRDRTVHPPPG